MSYYAGDKIKLTATFTDPSDGSVTTPGAVFLRIREPDGTVVEREYGAGGTPAIESPSTGVFTYLQDTTGKPGVHRYYWWSTGAGQAAEVDEFQVLPGVAAA